MTALSERYIIKENILDKLLSGNSTQDFALNPILNLKNSSVKLIYPVYPENPFLLDGTKKAIQRLKSFKKLDVNWNSYNAEKPSLKAIDQATRFVKHLDEWLQPVYFTAPGPNGEILVELKNGERSIEVFFNPDGNNEYALFVSDECIEEGKFDLGNLDKILNLLDN